MTSGAVRSIFTAAAGAVLAVLLVLLCRADPIEVIQSRREPGFITVDDAVCREEEDEEAPAGVKKEYRFTLSQEIAHDTHLAFYIVHQYVDVFLDGQKIYSLRASEKTGNSKTTGSNWVMIPLYREDSGKEIRVEITPVYESFRSREVIFLIGSRLAIYKDRLRKDLPQLILGSMAVLVGLMFLGVAGYSMLRRHRSQNLASLGLFSIMMGIWKLTDTRFTPFLAMDKPVFLFHLSVLMLMLGMIPLVKWMEEYFSKDCCRVLDGYCAAAALVCLLQLLLQLLGIRDLRETLLVTHIIIAVGVVIIIGSTIYDRIRDREERKLFRGSRLVLICVAGVVADMAAFYLKGNSSGLVFSLLAFLLYIAFMEIDTMFHYSEQELRLAEMDRQLAEQERKLTERRITAMLSQIRTHFIFNVLTTISGYCKIDAKKADAALIRFARYLRKNIRFIEEEGLIDFSVELEQLEDYVALEQLRFQDMIVFEKDLETTAFQLPPLTLQPIVENAIKHGLSEHGRSGTIWLRTMRDPGEIIITVEDDGAGFVPEACAKKDSVGLKNVRYRLESMMGGRLELESAPDKGTRVTIRLPVRETEK